MEYVEGKSLREIISEESPLIPDKVIDFLSAMNSDADMFVRYFKNMLKNGIYLAPSPFEVGFVSAAHSDEDIEKTIEANYKSLKEAQI